MRPLLILLFCGLARCQQSGGLLQGLIPHDFVNFYHEVAFEYHDTQNVLLAQTITECYFVRVDSAMEQLLQDPSTRSDIEAQIYHQIKDHTGETRSDIITLSADLNDYRAAWECALKQVFELIVQGYSTVATTIGD